MTSDNLKFFGQKSVLKTLVNNSFKALDNGYYDLEKNANFENHKNIDLRKKLVESVNMFH